MRGIQYTVSMMRSGYDVYIKVELWLGLSQRTKVFVGRAQGSWCSSSKTWLLEQLNVVRSQRRLGHGRRLVRMFCKQAWRVLRVPICLYVSPFGDGAMSTKQLVAWYEQLDFERHGRYLKMQRVPSNCDVRSALNKGPVLSRDRSFHSRFVYDSRLRRIV